MTVGIVEKVTHLANLTILLEHFEKYGGERNKWVVKEFNHCNEELMKELKEKHDETRTSADSSSVSQSRTQEPGSQPGRSKPIGPRSGLA